MPETATTEMDAVMEVVTATKNAIVRGIVTVSATAVTPEDAIGMSVAVKQQETHRTEQQYQTTEKARKEYTKETVQFEHVAPEQARVRSESRTMELLKRPFPDVIMRSRVVRDPGSRFTENASSVTFVEKTRGPAASDGTNVPSNPQDESGNSGTIKCLARISRSTLPWKSPAPGKIPTLFFRSNLVRPILATCLCQSTASVFLARWNSHECARSVYHNWYEVSCPTQYWIPSSKPETFLARQRPILQFQLFE